MHIKMERNRDYFNRKHIIITFKRTITENQKDKPIYKLNTCVTTYLIYEIENAEIRARVCLRARERCVCGCVYVFVFSAMRNGA